MGNRLTKIYTRTGDGGMTGLGDGSRVSKDSLRVEAMGDVDELNCTIGVLLTEALDPAMIELLTSIQHDLFDLGGELSIPGYRTLQESHVIALEQALDTYNAQLPPLKEFILPGGSRAAAFCHVSRTVCRRAERRIVSLADAEPISPLCQQYLNRLSDLMFVLARVANRATGSGDVLWRRDRGATSESGGQP